MSDQMNIEYETKDGQIVIISRNGLVIHDKKGKISNLPYSGITKLQATKCGAFIRNNHCITFLAQNSARKSYWVTWYCYTEEEAKEMLANIEKGMMGTL